MHQLVSSAIPLKFAGRDEKMDKFCKKDTTLSVCKHCLVVECPSRV